MDPAIGRVLQQTGGAHQRIRAATGEGRGSVLAERLTEAWGWGLISAPILQWFAEAAVEDGSDLYELQRLSGIGSSGSHEGNCHRDLVR